MDGKQLVGGIWAAGRLSKGHGTTEKQESGEPTTHARNCTTALARLTQRADTKPRLKFFSIASAKAKPHAVFQYDIVVPVFVQLQSDNSLHVHNA